MKRREKTFTKSLQLMKIFRMVSDLRFFAYVFFLVNNLKIDFYGNVNLFW